MGIRKATAQYEAWLGRHLRLIKEDLELKHERMRAELFPFMRATYYRWGQIWVEECGAAAKAPVVLAVGDLHVENFGTWRDIEGRLVWGINDFDEVWHLPYTNDLIRLVTSALLAGMSIKPEEGVSAFLNGYQYSLKAGGAPLIMAEEFPALRHMATERLHQPETFWQKLKAVPEVDEEPPVKIRKALGRLMPETGLKWRLRHRVAGLGSLGRERYLAIAEWRGGAVAREAKALAPSASYWAERRKGATPIYYQQILDHSVRCRDPFVHMIGSWIIRRLAPDCSRIELAALPLERDEVRLLEAMGWETANIHLGSRKASSLAEDLKARPKGWLLRAARKMEKAVIADWTAWAK
jgi:hypothetical protein